MKIDGWGRRKEEVCGKGRVQAPSIRLLEDATNNYIMVEFKSRKFFTIE